MGLFGRARAPMWCVAPREVGTIAAVDSCRHQARKTTAPKRKQTKARRSRAWHGRCVVTPARAAVRLTSTLREFGWPGVLHESEALRRSQGNKPGSAADLLFHDQLPALQPHGDRPGLESRLLRRR